jgi:arylsulfatase A-like enzyme
MKMGKKHIIFGLQIFLISLVGTACNKQAFQQSAKPNIIYIMADDMGYGDLGSYGSVLISTPNLDKMADEGLRFTQHYAGSTVCAPSRGSLMTGMHTGQAYIKGNFAMTTEGNLPLPEATVTVAELLKEAGYKTGVIGKWGLGGPGSEGGPNSQGFDNSYCYLDQRNAHEYYPPYLWENEQKVILDNQGAQNEYSHHLFTEKALKFIEDQGSKPFFLYLAYTIPHGKYQIPDDAPYSEEPWTQRQKNYAAMVTLMDKDIGTIMELLKTTGIDGNTVVFFTSDNGGVPSMSDFFSSNGISRGYKGDLYEGGIRAPLIVRWPDKISQGQVSDHISAFWDFLPTACDLADIKAPLNISGISYLPELLGSKQEVHEYLYWEYFKYHFGWQPGDEGPRNHFESQAIRMGNWKGVRTGVDQDPEGTLQLFDLENDPGEQHDKAAAHPDIVEMLNQKMSEVRRDTEFFTSN